MPARFAIAPESEKLGIELRQLHYGKRTGNYRIVYRIIEPVLEVHVLTVRHGARRPFKLEDIE